MQLDKVLEYLNARGFSKRYLQVGCSEQLTAAINEFGKKAVTAAIRDQYGSCPHIVKLLHGDWYGFKKYMDQCTIDEVDGWAHIGYAPQFTFHDYVDHGRIWFRNPPELIQGYTLRRWIEAGVECHCGNPFIPRNSLDHECPTCNARYVAKEYSYKVEGELGFEDTKEIRFGIELEYEDVTAQDVGKHLWGHALAKRDGSISRGVEVVTRPACMATHKERLKAFYKNVKTEPFPNTGMHVHVDKARLSHYQIGFMMQFLNHDALTSNLEAIAGRAYSQNTYCRQQKTHTMSYRTANAHANGVKETSKYSPLNTSKPATVEVRIFSSPATHTECAAKLDFVAALVKYASPYSVSVKTLKDKFKWNTFYKFMVDNKKEFPDFYEFFIKSSKLSLEAA